VTLISPQFANSNVDLPALPAEAYRLVEDKNIYGIMDIGGDDRGAYALGRYVPAIKAENNYRMVFVANCYRPLTRTPEEALEVMREIEAACGLAFTDIINNSNLGPETTPETVLLRGCCLGQFSIIHSQLSIPKEVSQWNTSV
jgi:hypothetical protein